MAKSWFHAAKCFDQAILICKDMNNFQDISGLAKEACGLYQQHGSPEAGAASLDKAAKILEANQPALALPLYQQALDVVLVNILIGLVLEKKLSFIFCSSRIQRDRVQSMPVK
jgi:hypothetical protein